MPSTITDLAVRQSFKLRLERYGEEILTSLQAVYGDTAPEILTQIERRLAAAMEARPADLRRLDEARLLSPDWLQSPDMIGYVAYVDRFAGTLRGIEDRLPHLESLGVRLLHLMPLLETRDGENDGGYAVVNYEKVRPDLGTADDLEHLAATLRSRGISLELDLVLNHVAREHEWAEKARAGDPHYRDYFYTYPDRTEPDRWEETLPEIFPDFAPGNFTWDEALGRWVWTTFNAYQWDVNWSNPNVLLEYLDILLFHANRGVEVFRLDAIAFIWKRLGTQCQNEPEVHHLTRILRAALRIAAPAVAFKAEAIVGPTDLITYLGRGPHHGRLSDMAYHNAFMVHLWSSLASRDTRLMTTALRAFPPKPSTATWGTYVRCHDDIGWAISDADAAAVGLSGPAHRAFLSDFYSGEFVGSFASGLVFQHNPATGDRRISGSLASLAGLEGALAEDDSALVDTALARIRLLHTAILGFGGLPLLYMGDEIALLSDHSYATDPALAADNRWAHRPFMNWELLDGVDGVPWTPAARVLADLRHVISVRRSLPQLHASVESEAVESPDPRVFVLLRKHPEGAMVQLYNFSEEIVAFPTDGLHEWIDTSPLEALSGVEWSLAPSWIPLEPYQVLWFVER